MAIAIQAIDHSLAANWDTFVSRHGGNYCHAYGWRYVFEHAYALKTFYLAAMDGEEWCGILPVAILPNGSAVSLPYCNYGGILVSRPRDIDLIRGAFLDFLKEHGVHQIEMRELGGPPESGEMTMILHLPESAQTLWKNIGDKVRNQIRKSQRFGFEIRWGADQLNELYDIYADNMGRLGTPVHGKEFLRQIVSNFKEQSDILTIRYEGRVIAAMLVLKYGDTWIDPIASSRIEFKHMNPNMLLYWIALEAACSAGAKQFDFGRSQRLSGTYQFKRQWGAFEVPLNYHAYQNCSVVPSVSTNFYRSKKAKFIAHLWSMLPGMIQRTLGPILRRYMP